MMNRYPLFLLLLLLLAGVTASAAAPDNLELYWTFDSPYPNGYVEPDASGNSHDGLLVWYLTRRGGGGEYLPGEGVFGGAGVVVDRGSILARDSLTLPSTWSVSMWLKPLDQVTRYDNIIAFRSEDGATQHFSITFNQSEFKVGVDVGSSFTAEFSPNAAWAVDQWLHLVVTYGASEIKMYLNGSELIRNNGTSFIAWDPSTPVVPTLTGYRGQSQNRFTGPIDEFRIYGDVLSSTEVADLADPASSLYTTELLPPVADPGMGCTAWLDGGTATFQADGAVLLPGQNGGATTYLWEVVEEPLGAVVSFSDATDPETTVTVNMEGGYQLRLTTSNGSAGDESLVNAAVFTPEGSTPTTFYTHPGTPILVSTIEPERTNRLASGQPPVVAHYTFDEGTGTTAATGSTGGSFNIGTSTWSTQGIFGGALHVAPGAATPQVFDLGTFTDMTNEFSLSFWVNSDRTDKRGDLFRANGTGATDYWKLHNQHNQGGLPDGYGELNWGVMNAPAKLGQEWNHIVITYSTYGDFRKLYVNGNLEQSRKFDPLDAGSDSPRLLFSNVSGSYAFRGLLDDVVLYATTLNNEEVWALYNAAADTLVDRVARDPYKTGAYRDEQVQQYFPEPDLQPVTNGFAESRFGDGSVLPAYEHPRTVFARDDLPAIRAQARTADGNRTLAEILQYTEVERLSNMDTNGNYLLAFSLTGGNDSRGIPYFSTDNGAAATIVAEAYLALLEADSEKARKIIDWLIATAALQRPVIDASRLATAHWRHDYHDILQRRATPLIYDWLYPWMTTGERATIRGIIADAAAGNWSIGMWGQPTMDAHLSNWEPWITGELLLALTAIYEEDGFDPETYQATARAVNLSGMIFGDEESGASAEGMGKASLVTGSMAMLSRSQPLGQRIIGSKMPFSHVRKFMFHRLAPWGGKVFVDAENGGMVNVGASPAVRVLHYAYPDEPIINYLKHVVSGGVDNYGDLQLTTFSQDSHLMSASYNQDWTGPADLEAHLQHAAAAANEPLGYFSNYRGFMIGRSDWTADALQLIFQPKSLTQGHLLPSRGYFVVNALGRTWVPFDGHNAEASKLHSVVTVDGVGQDISAVKVLFYEGAANTTGSSVEFMGTDLTPAYRQINDSWETLNDTRLHPDTRWPWADMSKRRLAHWEFADRPGQYLTLPPTNAPAQTFEYAYRTATLVRGSDPYVVIVDDLKKDAAVREYNWSMTMPQDIYTAGSYAIGANSVTFTDPNESTKHLLLEVIDSHAPGTFDVTYETFTAVDGPAEAWKLNYRANGDRGRFRVMLYPYEDGAPLPVVSGSNDTYTIVTGTQTDVVELVTSQGNVDAINVTRDGEVLGSAGTDPFTLQTLPFTEDFEDEDGDLLGGPVWQGLGSGTLVVSNGTGQAGTKGLTISAQSNDTTRTFVRFADGGHLWVYTDLHVKAAPTTDASPAVDGDALVAMAFDTNGFLMVRDNGIWRTAAQQAGGVSLDSYNRVTVRQDLTTRTWDVWLNGSPVDGNIAFAGGPGAFFGELNLAQGAGTTGVFDNIEISPFIPDGLVGAGAATYSEWVAGIDWPPGADTSETGDPDGDGIPNCIEYALDTDPNVADSGLRPYGDVVWDGSNAWFAIHYRRNRHATDLGYGVDQSPDMIGWTNVTVDGVNAIREITDPDPDGDATAEDVRVRVKALLDWLSLRLAVTKSSD